MHMICLVQDKEQEMAALRDAFARSLHQVVCVCVCVYVLVW